MTVSSLRWQRKVDTSTDNHAKRGNRTRISDFLWPHTTPEKFGMEAHVEARSALAGQSPASRGGLRRRLHEAPGEPADSGSLARIAATTRPAKVLPSRGILSRPCRAVGHDSCLVLQARCRFGSGTSQETYPTTGRIPVAAMPRCATALRLRVAAGRSAPAWRCAGRRVRGGANRALHRSTRSAAA